MSLREAVKKEPIAAASLLIALLTAALGSPIFLDWYLRPDIVLEGDFKNKTDARCAPFRLRIRNDGDRPAVNVLVQYDVDFFTRRGDVEGYYSGDIPIYGVKKRVDYITAQGEIRIPRLMPKQEQEFWYVETVNDLEAERTRQQRISQNDKQLLRFPRITLISHDNGVGKLRKLNADCERGQ